MASLDTLLEQPSKFSNPLVNAVCLTPVTVSLIINSMERNASDPVFFTRTSSHHPEQVSSPSYLSVKFGLGVGVIVNVGVNVGVGVGGGVKTGRVWKGPVNVAYSPHNQQDPEFASGFRMNQYLPVGSRP